MYEVLEPLLADYRRMVIRTENLDFAGSVYSVIHMDEFVWRLLKKNRVCGVNLPRIMRRQELEELGDLETYKSPLLAELP